MPSLPSIMTLFTGNLYSHLLPTFRLEAVSQVIQKTISYQKCNFVRSRGRTLTDDQVSLVTSVQLDISKLWM